MRTKPAWPRGLKIGPQHLQHADAYHEECLQQGLLRLGDEAWGINEIDWDLGSLARGQLVLRHLEAILEDGTELRIGSNEAVQELSIPLSDLGSRDTMGVYVGVPRLHPTGTNVDPEGSRRPLHRYTPTPHVISDITTGHNVDAQWLQPNVFLLSEADRLRSYDVVQCGRIMRDHHGNPTFDQTYVPPLWRVRASAHLTERLDKLLEGLVALKTWADHWRALEVLAARRLQLRGLLGSAIADVSDLLNRHHTGPHEAYLRLVEILATLAAFTPKGEFSGVPAFNHVDLGATFSPIFEAFTQVLREIGAERHREVPLHAVQGAPGVLQADLRAPGLDQEFFVAVAGHDVEQVKRDVLALMKLGPFQEILGGKYATIPALPLRWHSRPAGLPEVQGVVYFQLDKASDIFIAISREGRMGIHCPINGVTGIRLYAIDSVTTS